MAGLDDILGNQTLRTIFTWQIAAQVLGSLMAPFLTQLQQLVNHEHPEELISPAEAADMVLRGWLDQATGEQIAEGSGIRNGDFKLMVDNTGQPPGLAELMEAFRRGIIPKSAGQGEPALDYGIRTSRVRDEWIPVLEALRYQLLSPQEVADMVLRGWLSGDAGAAMADQAGISADDFALMVNNVGEPPATELLLEAFRRDFLPFDAAQGEPSVTYGIRTSRVRNEWIPLLEKMRFTVPGAAEVIDGFVKGHIDETTAKQKFSEAGLNPETDWEWLAFTRGNPPGLADVAKLVHRGLVPKDGVGPGTVSFEQAVRESAYMDKWSTPLFEGFTYVPPVRTIVALLRADAITPNRGRELFAENGVRPEDADAYIAEATQTKVAADKELAKGDVETLYYDQAIDNQTASSMLQALGYRNGVDQYLLTLVDLRREMAIVHAATAKIGNYYIARKINKATASSALDGLSVPPGQRDQLIAGWDIERTTNVKLLSPTDIADAFKYGIIDQGTAQDNLVADGYTPYDAWIYLSVKSHGPLPNPPPVDALIPV